MKKVEIKQVILLHPMKFVCQAFEKFSKNLGVEAYTLEEYESFGYLIKDLKPDAIIIHTDIYIGFPSEIQKDLGQNRDFKLLLWGTRDDVAKCDLERDSALIEPVDLGQLDDIFKSLLAQIQ